MSRPKQTTAEILALARSQGATKTPEKIEPPPEDSIPLPPLVKAAANGDIDAVIRGLADRANVNEAHFNGMTALCFALRRGHLAPAHYLVDAGADVNCNGAEIPPLHDAIASDDIAIVKKMLEKGANIHAQSREDGLSALMRAESEAMIEFLVECGASVNTRNRAGQDAVDFHRFQSAAVRRHEKERVEYYAKLREASSFDPKLQAKLMKGLENGNQEPLAKEHDALALRLERLRT